MKRYVRSTDECYAKMNYRDAMIEGWDKMQSTTAFPKSTLAFAKLNKSTVPLRKVGGLQRAKLLLTACVECEVDSCSAVVCSAVVIGFLQAACCRALVCVSNVRLGVPTCAWMC
eukprot:2875987-Rhodomonas_salina.1